jgi:hypothetical protein
MNAGGFVTVVDPAGPPVGSAAHKLKTIAGVQPGDHLVVNDTTHVQFVVHVTVPYVADLSVNEYKVTSPCGSGTAAQPGAPASPIVDVLLTDCPATTDLLVTVHDTNLAVMKFAYAPSIAVTSQANIDLSSSTYSNPNSRVYQIHNVPADAPHGPIVSDAPLAAGGPMQVSPTVVTTGTGTDTGSTIIPMISGLSYLTRVDLVSTTYTDDTYVFLDNGPFSDTYDTDLASRLIGWVPSPAAYDATAHTASWTEVAAGGAPDASRLELDAMRSTLGWKWELFAAHTANTFAMPTLVDDAATYNVAAADLQTLALTLAKIPGGYAAVRQNIFATDIRTAVAGQMTLLTVEMPQ